MRQLLSQGLTLAAIGQVFGVSPERIRQILVKAGVTTRNGRNAVQRIKREAERNAAALARWGHDWPTHRALRRHCALLGRQGVSRARQPIGAFIQQRSSAKTRGIPWTLTLAEWWRIWQESGRWSERGVGQGHYGMSRKGDVGPYSRDNVFIQLSTLNNSNRPQKRSGLPMGVSRQKDYYRGGVLTGRFVAQKMIGGKPRVLGVFETVEEAERAYRAA